MRSLQCGLVLDAALDMTSCVSVTTAKIVRKTTVSVTLVSGTEAGRQWSVERSGTEVLNLGG